MNYPNGLTPVEQEVRMERANQDVKWGIQNHDVPRWISILVEEVGKVAQADNKGIRSRVRERLVTTAAVAVAAIERLDRGEEIPA